jgi:hypothetical protein
MAVHAQAPDFFCYMQDSTGRIVDLSSTICTMKSTSADPPKDPEAPKTEQATKPAANPDASFEDEFSKLLNDPSARQTASIVGSAETANMAKGVCQGLDAGGKLPDPKEQEKNSRYPASYFSAVNTAAVKAYCPQHEDKLKS